MNRAILESDLQQMASLTPEQSKKAADALLIMMKLTDVLVHEVGGIDRVLHFIKGIHDKYISQLDIEYVPEFLEKEVVDPVICKVICESIRQWHIDYHNNKTLLEPPEDKLDLRILIR